MQRALSLAIFAVLFCYTLEAPAADPTVAPTTKPPIKPVSCAGHDPNKYFRDPDNPHIFHECSHGRWIGANYCPGDLIFDEKLQTCDRDGGDVPLVKCPKPDGLFEYPGNHHKFIECHDGIGYAMTCPEDLVFVEVNQTCVYNDWGWTWPTDAPATATHAPTTKAPTAAPSSAAPTSGPSSAAPTSGPSSAAPTSRPSSAAPTGGSSTVRPSPPPFKCPKKEGLFEYPGNHHKFIECQNGIPNVLTCPEKLVFVESNQTCVFNDMGWTWPTEVSLTILDDLQDED